MILLHQYKCLDKTHHITFVYGCKLLETEATAKYVNTGSNSKDNIVNEPFRTKWIGVDTFMTLFKYNELNPDIMQYSNVLLLGCI